MARRDAGSRRTARMKAFATTGDFDPAVMSARRSYLKQPAMLLPFALLTAGWLGSFIIRGVRRVLSFPRTRAAGAAHNHVRGLRLLSSGRALHRVGPLCALGPLGGGETDVRPRSAGGVAIATGGPQINLMMMAARAPAAVQQ